MRTRIILIFALLLSGKGLVLAQDAGSVKPNQLFDEDWKFSLGDHKGAGENNFDDKGWQAIDLPHDWSIAGAPDRQNPSKGAGGYFPTGVGWYRKSFIASTLWKRKEISICFEGVYMNAEVFVNGRSLGVHPYGYSTFYYNITPFLVLGKENVIAVRVDNSEQINCRWYSGSGIYRHVRLLVKDPTHIDPWGVAITTPGVSGDKATVDITGILKNDSHASGNVVLSTEILDPGGKVVAGDRSNLRLDANGHGHFTRMIVLARPLLWSVDSPNLYRARLTVMQGGKRLDEYTTSFGVRTISFSVEHGFELNGRTIKLYGGCVHHDNGCLGAAAFDRAEERKVELLKAAGFNAVRTSHNPPSIAFLDACDRLGLLVIDEAFDGWRQAKNRYDYARFFDDWWRRDLSSMVLRDRNHPSIVIWSVGNEILERKSPGAIKTARELVSLVHQYDATRPVTSAMTTWDKEWEIYDPLFAVQDIGGYNYQLFRAASDHQRVPSRIIVQTESYPRDVFINWNTIRHSSYIIGDFVWTAMDYLGESGIGRNIYPGEPDIEFWQGELFPWHGSNCGDIDLTGWRKPVSHYRSMLNNGREKLYMAVREPEPDTGKIKETGWSVWPTWESWTWPGRVGKDMQVEVYSRYPAVRLYLNDSLIGEKPTAEPQGYKATFSVPYTQGSLKAAGIENGKELESTMLRTAGDAAKIRLTGDRKDLVANGEDLVYVTVEVTDKNGYLQPNATNRLYFKLEGPGIIAGVGNADMKDTDNYAADNRKAWHGRALAVIRSTHAAGEIKLTVTAQGLSDASLEMNASSIGSVQSTVPKPCGPIPSANQLTWQDMEFYAFVHLSVNTFTGQEWGNGDEDPKIFNPDSLDCRQWARIAKEAGMKGIILTAKHHSGFCLWPSKYTAYSVKNCPWRQGKGDIVRDLAKACKEYGLKLGIYLSPWDRNSAVYGKPEYITYFRNQLRELLTNYGDIFEVWFDGANGGSGYYGGARETRTIDRRTYYDWPNTYKLVRSLQPKAVIWNDGGDRADLRWVGTEAGNVGETNWSLLNDTGDVPYNMLHYGVENGNSWVPAEVNTSIRPGWFYHAYEDSRVKTLPQLLDIYYSSEGRNGALLLNFPIDRHGLIPETDEKAVLAFAKAVRTAFSVNLARHARATASNVRGNTAAFAAQKAIDGDKTTYWATDDSVTQASLTLDLDRPISFNRFLVQEYIALGQRVKAFTVEALVGGEWKMVTRGTTIGYKRILRFPTVRATKVRFTITDAKACPAISNVGLFNSPEVLSAPAITEQFDSSRKNWKILGTADPKAYNLLDGDPLTAWQQPKGGKMPIDLVIDLGKEKNLTGFRYLPDQGLPAGIITNYQFYVSTDTVQWTLADKGEFSNIQNNPGWQLKTFTPVKGRYVRLRALPNTQNDDAAGYAEFDIITK